MARKTGDRFGKRDLFGWENAMIHEVMARGRSWAVFLSFSVASLGCSGPGDAEVDGGSEGDAGSFLIDASSSDAGNDAGERDGGMQVSAEPITLPTLRYGTLRRQSQLDRYSFDALAGQWVDCAIEGKSPVGAPIRASITLYDAELRQIARSDSAPGAFAFGPATLLSTRIPSDGRFYLEVKAMTGPDHPWPDGGGTYVIRVESSPALLGGLVAAEDAPDTAEPATPFDGLVEYDAGTGLLAGYGGIRGELDSPTDVDVYSFENVATREAPNTLYLGIMPSGTDGWGGAGMARIWVTDVTGSVVYARNTSSQFTMPALEEAGTYLLWVSSAGGSVAPGIYTAWLHWYGTHNRAEAAEPNDTIDAAEPLELLPAAPTTKTRYLLTWLGDGDVDRFSVAVSTGRLFVECLSALEGSGVVGLRQEIRNAADETLATTIEDPVSGSSPAGATVTAGTYQIVLSKDGQDPDNRGNWARCAVNWTR